VIENSCDEHPSTQSPPQTARPDGTVGKASFHVRRIMISQPQRPRTRTPLRGLFQWTVMILCRVAAFYSCSRCLVLSLLAGYKFFFFFKKKAAHTCRPPLRIHETAIYVFAMNTYLHRLLSLIDRRLVPSCGARYDHVPGRLTYPGTATPPR
jgi:hypothetical protein